MNNSLEYAYPEYGKPLEFDVDRYLDVVEDVICCDELENALWMLDHMPAYFRANPVPRAKEIRAKLYQQIMTVVDYATDIEEGEEENKKWHGNMDLHEHYKLPHFNPRGPLAVGLMQQINEDGFVPDITELGPANYWLPAALSHKEVNYSYHSYSVNKYVHSKWEKSVEVDVSDRLKKVFCCFEVMEHLWHEDDIFHFYAKTYGTEDADYIMISTPLHTLAGGRKDWKDRTLAHLRTYTAKDLHAFCERNWPNFDWDFYASHMMVMVGKKKEPGYVHT